MIIDVVTLPLCRKNLRFAEEKKSLTAGSICEMDVGWKGVKASILATLPMYRHLFCTLTSSELWTEWEDSEHHFKEQRHPTKTAIHTQTAFQHETI